MVVESTERGETPFFVRFERVEEIPAIVDWVEEHYPVAAYLEDPQRNWVSFVVLSSEDLLNAHMRSRAPCAPCAPTVIHPIRMSDLVRPANEIGFSSEYGRVPVAVATRDVELLGLYAGELLRMDEGNEAAAALVRVVERAFSTSVSGMLKGIRQRIDVRTESSSTRIRLRATHGPVRVSVGIATVIETLVAEAVIALAENSTGTFDLTMQVVENGELRHLVVTADPDGSWPESFEDGVVPAALQSEADKFRRVNNGAVEIFVQDRFPELIRIELGRSPRLLSVIKARADDKLVAIPSAPVERTFILRDSDIVVDPYGNYLVRSVGRLLQLIRVNGEAFRAGSSPVGKTCILFHRLSGTAGLLVDEIVGHDMIVRDADENREVFLSSGGERVPLVGVE